LEPVWWVVEGVLVMKMVRSVAGLAALLSLVGCASTKPSVASDSTAARPPAPAPERSASASANVIQSKEGGFRVEFPFSVQEERSEQTTSAGPLTLHTYVATDPLQTTAYYVSYTDFPVEAVARIDPGDVIARASLGAVDTLGATDVSTRALDLGGIPGQEVTATTGGNVMRGRFYMVGPRLYQQLLIHPVGQPPPDVDQFFSSFQVDPEAAQALGGSGRPRPEDDHF
jgi:hypothetical protein